MSSLIFAVVLWVINPKRLCVSQEVQTVARAICCVSQPFCRLGGVMKISDVKRQGLAVLSRRLGLTRRRRLGRAGFKFKLTLLSHCRLNGVFDKKEKSRENALCLTICAQRDLLRVSSCLPNRILEVEQLVSFHQVYEPAGRSSRRASLLIHLGIFRD